MPIKVTFFVENANPNTIWNKLAAKLGREPTREEAKAEVLRIMEETEVKLAGEGKLRHQRQR